MRVIAFVAVAMLLAACGGDDEPDAERARTAGSSTATTTAADTERAETSRGDRTTAAPAATTESPTESPSDDAPPAASRGPDANFVPVVGRRGETFALVVTNFRPRRTLNVTIRYPNGRTISEKLDTDGTGRGARTFLAEPGDPPGDYVATVKDPVGEATATAVATLEQ